MIGNASVHLTGYYVLLAQHDQGTGPHRATLHGDVTELRKTRTELAETYLALAQSREENNVLRERMVSSYSSQYRVPNSRVQRADHFKKCGVQALTTHVLCRALKRSGGQELLSVGMASGGQGRCILISTWTP